jgi:hypothetical protein
VLSKEFRGVSQSRGGIVISRKIAGWIIMIKVEGNDSRAIRKSAGQIGNIIPSLKMTRRRGGRGSGSVRRRRRSDCRCAQRRRGSRGVDGTRRRLESRGSSIGKDRERKEMRGAYRRANKSGENVVPRSTAENAHISSGGQGQDDAKKVVIPHKKDVVAICGGKSTTQIICDLTVVLWGEKSDRTFGDIVSVPDSEAPGVTGVIEDRPAYSTNSGRADGTVKPLDTDRRSPGGCHEIT